MPYVPHTPAEVRAMLEAIGAPDIEALFDEIPPALRSEPPADFPEALGEAALRKALGGLLAADRPLVCFAGAGAYDHHVPAPIWPLCTRGEYYSAYTPYQAEASQGTLQLLYEYQSMMAALTGMPVSNASLYDGATALAEAVLMALRLADRDRPRRVLLPGTLNPFYRACLETIVQHQAVEIDTVPYDPRRGAVDPAAWAALDGGRYAAVVLQQPNVFGVLESVHEWADWAAEQGCLSIALVNPMTLGVLEAPGAWGDRGVDIVCGEGQPLGIPLSGGGPYFGFLCCRRAHVRQLPGRLVGRTVDRHGRPGFVLTLQAREQHIRRSRATSNICTNQGLMVTAATIYLALMGPQGLAHTAAVCHANTRELVERLCALPGVERALTGAFFHECLLRLPLPAETALAALAERGILGGVPLGRWMPELGDGALLVCATELRDAADRAAYAEALAEVLADA